MELIMKVLGLVPEELVPGCTSSCCSSPSSDGERHRSVTWRSLRQRGSSLPSKSCDIGFENIDAFAIDGTNDNRQRHAASRARKGRQAASSARSD